MHICDLHIVTYKTLQWHIFCKFRLCIFCIFSAYLVLHILAYFGRWFDSEFCILMHIMHIMHILSWQLLLRARFGLRGRQWWSLCLRVPSAVCWQNCFGGDTIVPWLLRGLSRAESLWFLAANTQRCWLHRTAGSLGPCVKCDITMSVALWQSICIISLHTNILSPPRTRTSWCPSWFRLHHDPLGIWCRTVCTYWVPSTNFGRVLPAFKTRMHCFT